MCTHNLCFEQKYENSKKKNQPKIVIFTVLKKRCMLHGRVCVMSDLCDKMSSTVG